MPNTPPPCPACSLSDTYEDRALWVCPHCGHEWAASGNDEGGAKLVRDANGVALKDGDSVSVIKDLKFRGGVVKVGTKVKGIRLVDGAGNDGHDIDCKIPGIGSMGLKSEFVKKITE